MSCADFSVSFVNQTKIGRLVHSFLNFTPTRSLALLQWGHVAVRIKISYSDSVMRCDKMCVAMFKHSTIPTGSLKCCW
jgi:hypothetical protein